MKTIIHRMISRWRSEPDDIVQGFNGEKKYRPSRAAPTHRTRLIGPPFSGNESPKAQEEANHPDQP